jgi:3-methyl-2-oxobutanoate hydroxymethyltransferase
MNNVSIRTLIECKNKGEKFSVLTAYDATFSHIASSAGIEVLLVGDSLGMVCQGKNSTLPVTIADMEYHTRCVSQGNQGSLIMADMPFMSYSTLEQGQKNAALLMQAGAHMVKVEGDNWLVPLVKALAQQGVPVCAHLGLTPQSVNKLGGYRVQGRDDEKAKAMIEHSKALADAGADCILLECVPSSLAKSITKAVNVPVIGIGAGSDTDAQVLVVYDMLGLNTGHTPKFVKNFMTSSLTPQQAIETYAKEVKAGKFPGSEHEFS